MTTALMHTKVCRACGTSYETEYDSSQYCTLKCRDAEKRRRRKARDTEAQVEQIDNRFFAEVENPTQVQLSKYAELVQEELTNDKPIRFFGTVPMFQAPNGVIFAQQQGLDHVEWLMMHPAMVE